MDEGTNTIFASEGIVGRVNTYYATVEALTPKDTTAKARTAAEVAKTGVPPISPLLFLVPLATFAILLGLGFAIRIYKHMSMARGVLITGVLALLLSVPLVFRSYQEHTQTVSQAGPDEIPRDVIVSQTGVTSAVVTWKTDAKKLGAVRLSLAPFNETSSRVIIGDSGKMTTSHTVNLVGLTSGTPYDLEVLSGVRWYEDNGRPLKLVLIK